MLPGLVGGLAFAALLAYAGYRFLRGDWAAQTLEDQPEDFAEEDSGDWDDDDPDRP
jgi:hypothetical protein